MNAWEMNSRDKARMQQWAQRILWCLPLPFLMDLKVGMDFYILGPAYFAAVIRDRKRQLPAVLMGLAGLWALPGSMLRWKYGLFLAVFLAEEWILAAKRPLWPFWKRSLAYAAGLGTVAAGLSLFGVLPAYQLLSITLEAAVMLGAACLYHRVLSARTAVDELSMAGASAALGSVLAAFHWVQVGSVIPSEILLLVAAMLGSYEHGIGSGMVLALPAGFFMRLTMTAGEGLLILSMLLVLLTGAFRELGQKAAAAAGFSGGCLWVILFMGGSNVMAGIWTVGAASLLFAAFPAALLQRMKRPSAQEHTAHAAAARCLEIELGRGAQAFQKIADLIRVPDKQTRITSQDLAYLKEDIATALCQECEKQKECWGSQYARTHNAVVCVMEASRQKGKVERKDLPDGFLESCLRAMDFVRTVNRHYELYRLNQSWENRMAQSAKMLQGQYEAMAEYLAGMREHYMTEAAAEQQVSWDWLQHLQSQGIPVKAVEIEADEREDRLRAVLETEKPLTQSQVQRCEALLSGLTGRTVGLTGRKNLSERRVRYSFADPNRFRVQLGAVTQAKDRISGDSYAAQRLDAQRFAVLLGDGMGSGRQAQEASRRALQLLEQLLLTGIEEEKAIRLLNAALVVSNQEEIFTTIDLALLNLHTGQLKLVKAGSCTTFIRSRAAVYVYHSQSLPVGILEEPEPETFSHRMEDQDLLLMISDGVIDQLPDARQGERWIRRFLIQTQEEDPQRLAEQLWKQLQPPGVQREDDRTILAVKIEKRGESSLQKKGRV